MQVILYDNQADPRTVDKGTKLVQKASVTATPVFPLNIVKPMFRLAYNSSYTQINYLYCSDLHRYYFVNRIIMESGKAMILHCESDVLMSFKTDIKNLKCICTRNQYDFNDYIQDEYPSSVKATTTNFIMASSTTPFGLPEDDDSLQFILTMNGLVGEST